MADDVKDAIEKNAQGPRRAKGDVGEVQQHSLKDQPLTSGVDVKGQADADRYLASREARSKPHKSLRFAKLSPPGA